MHVKNVKCHSTTIQRQLVFNTLQIILVLYYPIVSLSTIVVLLTSMKFLIVT